MKNKKINKIIFLSILTIAIIAIVGIFSNKVQAYDHNALNALDNAFEKDGITIIPFILDNSKQTITKTYLVSEFEKANLEITNKYTLPEIIPTGTVVKTDFGDYTILVYGDVDGNGKITVYDAQRVFDYWAKSANFSNVVFELAANVYNNDDKITVYDAQTIFDFWMGNNKKLVLNEPKAYVKYTTGIEVEIGTAKVNYKYNESINSTGIVVKLVWSDGHKEDVTSDVTVNTTRATTNKVEVAYRGYKATYDITVTNYITGINIVTPPTKVNYVEGDSISLSGIVVNAVYADNTTKAINESDVTTDMANAEYGKNTITVKYETNKTIDDTVNTFTDTFEINMIKRFSQFNIKSTNSNIEGLCYEAIDAIELKAGENEEELSVDDNISYKIYKADENDIYAEVNSSDAKIVTKVNNDSRKDAQIVVSLKAREPGKYKIVLESINGVTNKTGETAGVIVTVKESSVVNDIQIGDYKPNNRTNIKLAVRDELILPITFMHKYTDNDLEDRTVQISEVTYDRINNATQLPQLYKFLHRESDDSLSQISSINDGKIDMIHITPNANNINDKTLNVTVDGNNFVFNVEVEYPKLNISTNFNFDGENKKSIPSDTTYTLIPISLLQESTNKSIRLHIEDVAGSDKIINVQYKGVDCYDEGANVVSGDIAVEFFYTDRGNIVHTTQAKNPVDYIGFANVSGKSIDVLDDYPIVITYNNQEQNINIVTD